MVGHRDRAEAASRAVESSTSTGVTQSFEWSVCMCRSTSIIRRRRAARAPRAERLAGGAARRAAVDRLGLVGDPAPRQARAARLAQLLEQRGLAHEPLELAGEHVDVAGLEQQAESPSPAPPRRRAGARRRDGAGAERAHEQAGRGDLAERGRDDHVGVGQHVVLGPVVGVSSVSGHAGGCAAASARRRSARRPSPPTRSSGSRRRARRNSRSAPRSSAAENAIRTGRLGAARSTPAARAAAAR